MKRLYLIRHAKSSWKNPDLADFDRPLNKRGKENAPFMGRRLRKYNVKPDLLLSSPAKRALKTAKLIAGEIDFPKENIVTEELIYEAGVRTLVQVIQNLEDSFHQVMLFGHNPGFTALAECLTAYEVYNIPTCGIFCVDFEIDSWKKVAKDVGIVKFFDYPKKHLI